MKQFCRLGVNPGLDFRLTCQTKCSVGRKCDGECQRSGRWADPTIQRETCSTKVKYFSSLPPLSSLWKGGEKKIVG